MAEVSNALPPGWDCKYDARTSRYYFINHYTKQTTWEDPRLRYRQIHGTPTHVPVEHIPLQDLSNVRMARSSNGAPPGTPKSSSRETTLAQVPTDTEQAVSKISTMFPTVADTHIRLLMKKYMKSIFPQVEETILLDVLGNNENNVQKASEALKEMGFEKKDMKIAKSKTGGSKRESGSRHAEEAAQAAPVAPKILTQEEKAALKIRLQEKYRSIPERVVVLALESADFNAARAQQILDVVVQEETAAESIMNSAASTSACAPDALAPELLNNKIEESRPADLLKKSKSSLITPSPSIHAFQSDKLDNKVRRTKEKKNSVRETLQENTAPDAGAYRSAYLGSSTGPDVRLVKGSNNGMLLEDYVSWDGPDPRLRSGSGGNAQGPNRTLLMGRTLAQGANSVLRKGPARGLAQGSLYSQMQTITITESRGK